MDSLYKDAPGGQPSLPGAGSRLRSFIKACLAFIFIAFYVLPSLPGWLGWQQAHQEIQEMGIEAGAFYYTQVEKIRETSGYIHNAYNYAPSHDQFPGSR